MGGFLSKKNNGCIIGAGCIFTNNSLIIAGYQPSKKTPVISGIGGKSNKNEHFIETAHREMLEELFGIYEPTILSKISLEIHKNIKPQHFQKNGGYMNLIYTFENLCEVLSILSSLNITSKIYDVIPKNLEEVLLKRKFIKGAEIQQLALLPVCKGEILIAKEFLQDILNLNLFKHDA